MKYTLDLNNRPFNAIKNKTKKVEGRTNTPFDTTPYKKMQKGDSLIFINNMTNERLEVRIIFVHHYQNVKEMLKNEGVKNVLSSEPKTIEHGVESYHSLTGYKEGIKENGIYAIGIAVN